MIADEAIQKKILSRAIYEMFSDSTSREDLQKFIQRKLDDIKIDILNNTETLSEKIDYYELLKGETGPVNLELLLTNLLRDIMLEPFNVDYTWTGAEHITNTQTYLIENRICKTVYQPYVQTTSEPCVNTPRKDFELEFAMNHKI